MNVVCTDNRFELIAKYKAKLIEATNIETSEDEMKVIDSILFRLWQMGWLDIIEMFINGEPVVRCKDCQWFDKDGDMYDGYCDKHGLALVKDDFYCADGERKDGEG